MLDDSEHLSFELQTIKPLVSFIYLLFECKNRLMRELRETFIPNLYKCNPSAFKFNHMMSNNGVNLA